MDIKRIESFSKVYELRSISKAAQLLHLSQPTISTHISFLENELSVSLFDRIGREILPTQAADILYNYAKRLISLKDKAYTEIHELYSNIVGCVHIGGSTIPGHYFLPGILSQYRKNYKQVDLNLEIADSSNIENKILAGQIDVGVVGASQEHSELFYQKVMKDDLVVLGNTFFLSRKDKLEKEDLLQLPWVIREKGSGTRKAMEKGLLKLNMDIEDLNIQTVVNSTESVLKCIQAGLGVSITSRLAAGDLLFRDDITYSQVRDMSLDRFFYAVYHKQREFFPATKHFWELLISWTNQ